jgi:hypothetical protein
MSNNAKVVRVKANKPGAITADGSYQGLTRDYDIAEIRGMTLREYLQKDSRILNARQQTFWDTAVLAPAVAVTPQHVKELFRKGYTDDDTIMNVPATQIPRKGFVMTNMIKNGEFAQGTLTILKRIEVDLVIFQNVATTYLNTAFPSNTALTAAATNDPLLTIQTLKSQFLLRLKRGANNQVITEGLLEEFPSTCTISGAGGGGNWAQNGPGVVNDEKLMSPEVFEGGEDFFIEIVPLNDSVTFVIPIQIQVKLKTTQIFTQYR